MLYLKALTNETVYNINDVYFLKFCNVFCFNILRKMLIFFMCTFTFVIIAILVLNQVLIILKTSRFVYTINLIIL